jgi:aldehyde dehydrogenase (NAD+)
MIKKIFNKLSYEPVIESDSSVKSWINSHNNGHLTPFINGQFLAEKETDQLFQVKNPYNNDLLAKCVNADKSILNSAIDSALEAKSKWTSLSYTERGRIIYNMARNVQKHLQLLTACESLQTGRTSREIKDCDIAALIRTLYYYSGGVVNANELMESYEPIGVVAIIGHFDSPLLSMIGKRAAALVTGNTCLLVPNSLSPLSCYMFIDLCVQSGLPNGCVNLVVSDNDEILKFISTDPRIDCVTFDGNLTVNYLILIFFVILIYNNFLILRLVKI